MAYWIKIHHERDSYIIDLDSVSAFSAGSNKRITFWLPDSGKSIVINWQSNPEAYESILNYIKNIAPKSGYSGWVKIFYDRSEYLINITRITTFTCDASNRLIFWIPDAKEPIIINPQSNPEAYRKIQDYLQKNTGYTLP